MASVQGIPVSFGGSRFILNAHGDILGERRAPSRIDSFRFSLLTGLDKRVLALVFIHSGHPAATHPSRKPCNHAGVFHNLMIFRI